MKNFCIDIHSAIKKGGKFSKKLWCCVAQRPGITK